MTTTKTCYVLFMLIVAYATKNIHAIAINGGVSTKIKSHPYYVAILGSDGEQICGGALIAENIVVTAARCIANYDVSQLVVRVGSDDFSKPGKVITIAASRFDAFYDFVTNENDVGLLKLAKRIQQSPTASIIPLATSQPKTGTNAVLTGLDKNKKLTEVSVSLISSSDCSSGKYNYEKGDLFISQVCGLAKFKNACGGDPGSPLVANNQLVGLVSWAYACSNIGNPTVYTNIAALKSWITSTAKTL